MHAAAKVGSGAWKSYHNHLRRLQFSASTEESKLRILRAVGASFTRFDTGRRFEKSHRLSFELTDETRQHAPHSGV